MCAKKPKAKEKRKGEEEIGKGFKETGKVIPGGGRGGKGYGDRGHQDF